MKIVKRISPIGKISIADFKTRKDRQSNLNDSFNSNDFQKCIKKALDQYRKK